MICQLPVLAVGGLIWQTKLRQSRPWQRSPLTRWIFMTMAAMDLTGRLKLLDLLQMLAWKLMFVLSEVSEPAGVAAWLEPS